MQMQNVIEKGNDAHSEYEFNKVLSDHTDVAVAEENASTIF